MKKRTHEQTNMKKSSSFLLHLAEARKRLRAPPMPFASVGEVLWKSVNVGKKVTVLHGLTWFKVSGFFFNSVFQV